MLVSWILHKSESLYFKRKLNNNKSVMGKKCILSLDDTGAITSLTNSWTENKSRITLNRIICGFYCSTTAEKQCQTNSFLLKNHTDVNSVFPFSSYVQSSPQKINQAKNHPEEGIENHQWNMNHLWANSAEGGMHCVGSSRGHKHEDKALLNKRGASARSPKELHTCTLWGCFKGHQRAVLSGLLFKPSKNVKIQK